MKQVSNNPLPVEVENGIADWMNRMMRRPTGRVPESSYMFQDTTWWDRFMQEGEETRKVFYSAAYDLVGASPRLSRAWLNLSAKPYSPSLENPPELWAILQCIAAGIATGQIPDAEGIRPVMGHL